MPRRVAFSAARSVASVICARARHRTAARARTGRVNGDDRHNSPKIKVLAMTARARCVVCVALALAGCGGGDGGGGVVRAPGQVIPPAGFTEPLAGLTVLSSYGSATVARDGAFRIGADGLAEVDLLASDGRLLMIGVAGGEGGGEISADTTAAALLGLALGVPLLPPDAATTARALIPDLAETDALAQVVAARLAVNPTALADGDPELDAALAGAQAAVLAAFDADVPRSRSSPLSGDLGADVVIEPDGIQSGVAVLHNPDGDGLVAQNTFRRPATLLAYRTATQDADGTRHELDPPVPAGDPVDIPPSSRLELFKALGDVVTGSAPWSPAYSAPFGLALSDAGTRAYYDLVVLGPSLDAVSRPAIYDDPRYATFVAGWKDIVDKRALDLFLGEIAGPLLEPFCFGKVGMIPGAKLKGFQDAFRAMNDSHLARLGVFLQSRSGFADGLRFVLEELHSNGAGAKSYDVTFAGYGGGYDTDYNNNSALHAHPDGYTYTFLATGDPTELPYDDQCYNSYGILAGFAVSSVGSDYWVAVYMSFEPIDILLGQPWTLLDLGGVVDLWYQWLDQAKVTITPHY